MWEIIGNISITGKIHWHCSERREPYGILGYKEGIKVSFNSPFSLYKGKEALEFIRQLIRREDISWIIPNHGKWTFDLDKLKKSYSQLSGIEWINGQVSLEPEIHVDPSQKIGSEGTTITFYILPEEVRGKRMIIKPPIEIKESLQSFMDDYPSDQKIAFLMMKYGRTPSHSKIEKAIKEVLEKFDIKSLKASDKEYHDDLFYNILTYIYGCDFGIAVFERILGEKFNPNVSLEVGYMLSLDKPICLLKDKTLKTLHTDIIGKLYKEFDTQAPEDTIPKQVTKWLKDKEIL